MALTFSNSPTIPRYESAIAAFLPSLEAGRKDYADKQAFAAAANAFGTGTASQQPNAIERLLGIGQGGPFTRPENAAVGAINAATPLPSGIPEDAWETIATIPTTGPAIPQSYYQNIRAAESGGNDAAANPNSSALGRYQFIDSTWAGLAQKYPELGLTPDGRTDPAQQERAIARFTQDNAAALSAAGIPINPGNLYAAHFLGAGGATKVLGQDPGSPLSAYLEPGVLQANPNLQGMTVGDFANWTNSKGGNAAGGYTPPMRNEGQVAGARAFAPDADTLRTLLASEATRPLAISLIQAQQEANSSQGRFVVEEGPNGSIWQRDTLTGQMQVLQGAQEQKDRRIIQGPDGNAYYEDGTRVLPGVDAVQKPGYRTLTADESTQLGLDPNKVYQVSPEGKVEDVGGSLVTVNTGNTGDGAFFGALDAADGKVFADLIGEAPNVGRKAVQIDQLEGLLGNINTGGGAALQQLAGEWGINTEGLDGIQAAQALINQIVPEQRQPGSGPMSDSDLALFKQSVPRLINQPGGNQMIIDTMRGINEYTRLQADIASRLAARQITRDEARQELANLPNPLEGYAERVRGSQQGGVAKPQTEAEYEALPSGTIFIDPDDGQTYRKP